MQVNTKALAAELGWVRRFIEKKTTIPILAQALFEVDGSRLRITGTDLEVAGVTILTGSGRDKWSVTAPISKLIQYLGKVEEETVLLGTTESHWLTVTHGVSCTKVAGMSRESYPELPTPPETLCTLRGLPLAVQRTAFAISCEESRFTLNGALLEAEEGKAFLIATDGHRLSKAPLVVKGVDKLRVMLPKFVLLEAQKFEGDCAFSMDEVHAFLDFGQRRIVARKLTGNFPDWRRVMGDDFPSHVFIPTKTTLKHMDRVALYADERSRAVKFIVDGGHLTLRADTVEQGQAEASIPTRGGQVAAPVEIGFNADYFADFLRVTDVPTVAFCWKDAKSACQLLLSDGSQYVVMPQRL